MVKSVRGIIGVVLTLALIMTLLPGAIVSAAAKPALNKTSSNILVGKTYDFNIKNKIAGSTYQWSSSNTKVATVSKSGLVKGIKKGTATITCKIKVAGKTYTLKAKANIIAPAKSIVINNKVKTLSVGETYDLNRTLAPKTSNDKTTWKSSDETIAKPNSLGKFTALKAGKVTITATTLSGAKDSVTITVVEEAKDLKITSADVKNGEVKVAAGKYRNVEISNTVGTAEVTLDNVNITGTLSLESGSAYKVMAKDAQIAKVKVVTPEIKSMEVKKELIPTLVVSRNTVIINVDIDGNISIEQSPMASIGDITIAPTVDGELVVSIAGFKGDIIINSTAKTDIKLDTADCDIQNAVIAKANASSKIKFVDAGNSSKIANLKINASASVAVDIKTKEIVLGEAVKGSEIVVSKPVEKVINNATDIKIKTEKDGKVDEITGKPAVTITPTPTPTQGGGSGGGGGGVPGPGPTPTPVPIPGVNVNNGVYTFDSHVIGFTVKVGSGSYDVTIDKVAARKLEKQDTYSEGGLTYKKTSTGFTYEVTTSDNQKFNMELDKANSSVKVSGGSSFTITSVIREYNFFSVSRGVTIQANNKSFNVTFEKLDNIRKEFKDNETIYHYMDTESNTGVTFTRLPGVTTYGVKVDGIDEFTMKVDIDAMKVTIIGGINFNVSIN